MNTRPPAGWLAQDIPRPRGGQPACGGAETLGKWGTLWPPERVAPTMVVMRDRPARGRRSKADSYSRLLGKAPRRAMSGPKQPASGERPGSPRRRPWPWWLLLLVLVAGAWG